MMDINTYMSLHLLVGLSMLQLAALFFDSKPLPYYPIEISRIAANTAFTSFIFRIVIKSLVYLYASKMRPALPPLGVDLVMISLLIIALFDDVNYPTLHTIGVGLLGLSAVVLTFESKHAYRHNLKLCFVAASIWALRLVAKASAVYFFEGAVTLQDAMNKSINIMYHGRLACVQPDQTLVIFRICGFLQWVVFAILLQIKVVP